MTRPVFRTIIGFALVAGINACANGEELPVQTESLRENLPLLEEAALNWKQDSYLVQAEVELLSGDSQRSLIVAGFQSPSQESESLMVTLDQGGSIVTERVPHTVPVRQTEPILNEHWELDTTDALNKALSEEGRIYLIQNADSQCSRLVLYRNVRKPGEPVEWSLSLSGCLLERLFQRTTIDPNTGEILSRQNFP